MIGAFNVATPELFHELRRNASSPRDLYHVLAQEKIKPGDTVVTFNYDLACERALHMAGLWEVGDGYGFDLGLRSIPSAKVKVLKLHGSTNWLGILFGGNMGFSQASSVYDHRPAVFRKREFEFLGYAEDIRDPTDGTNHSDGRKPRVDTSNATQKLLPSNHVRSRVGTVLG